MPANSVNGEGNTSLSEVSQGGHLEVVKYLIEHGADVNKTDDFGNTPWFEAGIYTCEGIVRYLASLPKIKLDEKSRFLRFFGLTALEIARRQNLTDIVQILEQAESAESSD